MKPDFSVSNIHVWTENMGSGHIQYTWKHLEYSIHRSISNTVHIEASRIGNFSLETCSKKVERLVITVLSS